MNTIIAYRRDLLAYENFLRASGLRVDSADRRAVERHIAGLSRRLQAASASRALTAVRGLYRFRAEEGMQGKDPTAGPARSPGRPAPAEGNRRGRGDPAPRRGERIDARRPERPGNARAPLLHGNARGGARRVFPSETSVGTPGL